MTDVIDFLRENQTLALAIVGVILWKTFPAWRPILVSLGLVKTDDDGKILPIEVNAADDDESLVAAVKATKIIEKQHEANGNVAGAEAARKAGAELFTDVKSNGAK